MRDLLSKLQVAIVFSSFKIFSRLIPTLFTASFVFTRKTLYNFKGISFLFPEGKKKSVSHFEYSSVRYA